MTQSPAWLETLTGRNLLREEVRQVRRALDNVFGDQLVQIGGWGDPGLFRRLARTRRTAVVTETPVPGADMVARPDSLAIASDCVDAVLLPHTLELARDPHAVLREVDRILRPDGNLVVLGFNPWGWWGLRHVASRRGFPPGSQRMISEGRLHDWLRLLDFKVYGSAFYYFVPPIMRRATPRSARGRAGRAGVERTPDDASQVTGWHTVATTGTSASERSVRRLSALRRGPIFAGCYALCARKQIFAITPIRPSWHRRPTLVTGLVNPTTRNAA